MTDNNKANGFDLSAGVPKMEGDVRPQPKFADRISKRVLGAVFIFFGVLVVVFLASLNNMDDKPGEKKVSEKAPSKTATMQDFKVPTDVLGVAASDSEIGPKAPSLAKPIPQTTIVPSSSGAGNDRSAVTQANASAPVAGMVPPLGAAGSIPDAQTAPVQVPPPTPEQLAERQAKQERLARLAAARSNGLAAKPFETGGAEQIAAPGIADLLKQAALGGSAMNVSMPSTGQSPKAPETEQDQKLEFLNKASKEGRGYHPHVAQAALSKNEIKVGSYIPMSLEQGINSDLPGEITARVSESIYDTISGCRMLIPALTKVIGRYDSNVALGQGRMLVAWSAMVFPDGSELNLAGMQGYDTSGQAGLQSDVDNHYLRLIGLSFGMSMITAGVQLSVPQPNPSANGAGAAQTPSQVIATALAQQYGQLGAQVIGKYLAVQPTLRNFPGERFMIMVPHTVVFPKVWRNRCGA